MKNWILFTITAVGAFLLALLAGFFHLSERSAFWILCEHRQIH